MFPPHVPRCSLTFILGSVLPLGILLFAIFFILSHKDQAVNGGHDIPQASSNAIRANQNPSSGTMGRSLPVSPSAAETHRKSNSNQWNRAQDRAISGHPENYEGRSRIEFQGNQSISTERLNEVVGSLKGIDRSEFLKELIDKIMKVYMTYGFQRINVNAEPDPTDPDNILITIDEGKLYTWGEISVESDILSTASATELFHIEKGWPANIVEIGNAIAAYRNNFQEQGYIDCVVTPHTYIDEENGKVNLFLDFNEGPRYVVHSISLDSPNAQSLFAELQGQIFSPSEFRSLLAKSGLTTDDVRLEFDSSRGEVSIFSSAAEP